LFLGCPGANGEYADHERFHGEDDAERAEGEFEEVNHLNTSKVLESRNKQYD